MGPFLHGAVGARERIRRLDAPKQPLKDLTVGAEGGVDVVMAAAERAILAASEATDEQIRALAEQAEADWWATNRDKLSGGDPY